MNNGLSGQYLPALETWNISRREAAALVDAYHRGRVNPGELDAAVKRALASGVFNTDGRVRVDDVARRLFEQTYAAAVTA